MINSMTHLRFLQRMFKTLCRPYHVQFIHSHVQQEKLILVWYYLEYRYELCMHMLNIINLWILFISKFEIKRKFVI